MSAILNLGSAVTDTVGNSWDPNNGAIARSSDQGATWSFTNLTFKVGGNMPGRGSMEALPLVLDFDWSSRRDLSLRG